MASNEDNLAKPNLHVHTIDNIAIDLDNGREIDTLFLDFSKAFDKVPYKRLQLNLSQYHHGIYP